MPKIVLATGNAGKVRELCALLAGLDIEIVPQSSFAVPEVPETGLTFVENAILKARNAAHHTGLAAIADDSGLTVDVLRGTPGIYSARYAGANASDQENVAKLLAELRDIPAEQRGACFHCLVVYLRYAEDPVPLICRGTWRGIISQVPKGLTGFGYDPVFWVPAAGKTAAELDPEVKNSLSHRGQALTQLRKIIQLHWNA